MDTTTFLAQFWGWLLVIISFPFLLNRSRLNDLFELVRDKGFVLVSGYIALVLGLATVILHNVWVADWRVVITIFGWFSLIRGIVRIGWGSWLIQKITPFLQERPLLSQTLLVITVLLGAWLIWASY